MTIETYLMQFCLLMADSLHCISTCRTHDFNLWQNNAESVVAFIAANTQVNVHTCLSVLLALVDSMHFCQPLDSQLRPSFFARKASRSLTGSHLGKTQLMSILDVLRIWALGDLLITACMGPII